MSSTYEEYTNDFGNKYIARTDDDGKVSWIPTDLANSDYQAYLDKDKPVEHFTPMVTDADKS
jgi:hypothetical protein